MKDIIYLFTPWWGKSIGFILGYLTAGPAGAVFGVLIGNIFDIGLYNVLHTPQWHYYRKAPSEVKSLFMPALFKVMGHIAKTDGQVLPQHIDIARKIMREMKLYSIDKTRAMQYFNAGKAPYFKLETELRLIKQACYYQYELLSLFAETQYRAAAVTSISIAKRDRLNIIFMTLGFKPVFPERVKFSDYYHHSQQKKRSGQKEYYSRSGGNHTNKHYSKPTPPSDYAILGIKEGERAAIVKKAYRKIMSQIHPDRLIARGATEKEIHDATERAQEVRAAYERIKKSRGF